MVTIVQASNPVELQHVQSLLAEYFDFLRREVDTTVDDLSNIIPLAGYKEELAGLPGRYAPPDGRLLLAYSDSESAGCVAFYKWGDGICEVKRLWTRPQYRGRHIGRLLMERLINEARAAGYSSMILSTVDVLTQAIDLYTALGFEPTMPYFELPDHLMEHEVFLKLDLHRA